MKVVFIVPQLSQPRCIKRVQVFCEYGYEVEVYGYDNGLYSRNIETYPCPVHSVAVEGRKSKLRSINRNIRLVKEASKHMKKEDLVYIFGIELAGYYKLCGRNNAYLYEQADLNYTKLSNNFLVSVFKKIDKYLISSSYRTVLTSMGFLEYLYGAKPYPSNIVLLENRLNNELRDFYVQKHTIDVNSIRFAFIGAVRYPRTILTFAKVIAEHYPNHQFHFYGEGHSSPLAKELCEKYPANLFYHGGFTNPDDLPQIYSEVDLNVVCYDPVSMNVRIAEPNKLYESVFFKVPLIVSSGTFLERRVKEMGVGYSIDCTDEHSIQVFINSLTNDEIAKCQMTMEKIPCAMLFDNTRDLVSIIKTNGIS